MRRLRKTTEQHCFWVRMRVCGIVAAKCAREWEPHQRQGCSSSWNTQPLFWHTPKHQCLTQDQQHSHTSPRRLQSVWFLSASMTAMTDVPWTKEKKYPPNTPAPGRQWGMTAGSHLTCSDFFGACPTSHSSMKQWWGSRSPGEDQQPQYQGVHECCSGCLAITHLHTHQHCKRRASGGRC